MVTDKLTVTHQLLEQLSGLAGKANFIPVSKIGQALQFLEEKGIPTNKNEEYKYCNIEAIIRKEFKKIDGKENDLHAEELKKNHRIEGAHNVYVFNGRLVGDISDISGFTLSDITTVSPAVLNEYLGKFFEADTDALVALNTAYADRGLFLHVSAVVGKPIAIHYVYSTQGELFFNSRSLFIVDDSAQATITEYYHATSSKYFCNSVRELFIGEHAHCDHTIIQDSGPSAFTVTATQVRQQTYSRYTNACFTFSGALVRNNLHAAIDGEYAEANLFGLFITNGTQLVDNHTLVDHLKPNCQSNELYKGIAGGRSTAVFNGQIFVERDAQKTNAYQSSKNILLSDDATVNAKPELEIYADDVKCSHGTSTGKVDEDALFYLKARGIGEENARKLLLHAFAHEVIGQLKIAEVKEKVTALFARSLQD